MQVNTHHFWQNWSKKVKNDFFTIACFALLFTFLSLSIIHLNKFYSIEFLNDKVTSIKKLFGNYYKEKDFIEKNFVLVNVSGDISRAYYDLEDENNGYGIDSLQVCAVPNRKKLALLYKWLYENRDSSLYKLIVCDVSFLNPSIADSVNYDDTLAFYTRELMLDDKLISAGEANEAGFEMDIFERYFMTTHNNQPAWYKIYSGRDENTKDIYRGFINYDDSSNANFLKYKLVKSARIKSLPLLIYEKIYNKQISTKLWSYNLNYYDLATNKNLFPLSFAMNTFTPEFYFDYKDIQSLKTLDNSEEKDSLRPINMIDLNHASNHSEVIFKDILKKYNGRNKIIFIGSFDKDNINTHPDKHQTVHGIMDGSLIILNIYYNLVKDQNVMNFLVIPTLFIFYFFTVSIYMNESKQSLLNYLINHLKIEKHFYLLAICLFFISLVFNFSMRIILLEILLFILGIIFLQISIRIKIILKNIYGK